MQIFISNLGDVIISNPWMFLTSIGANLLILVKVIINFFTTKKIGRAKLAAKRYKELLIPLSQEFNNVRIETFVAYHGKKYNLLKKLLYEIFKLLFFKSKFADIKERWIRFKSPMIAKPSHEMVWDEPDFEKIDKILNEKRSLLNKELIEHWYRLKEAYFELEHYSDSDRSNRIIEFIIYISDLTNSTRYYLEKKYPNLLAE